MKSVRMNRNLPFVCIYGIDVKYLKALYQTEGTEEQQIYVRLMRYDYINNDYKLPFIKYSQWQKRLVLN